MKSTKLFIFLICSTFIINAQNPDAKFGFYGYGVKNKVACFLDSSTVYSDIIERTWNYGDSPTNYSATPTTTVTSHVYSAPGTYTVKLVVKNSFGLKDSISHAILIKDLKLPQLHIYQDAVVPQLATVHSNHIELHHGPFYRNKITYCEDTSNYSSSYVTLAYKKWKFNDPSYAPADTSLLQYTSNTYTTNPTTIRIVYYYAFPNPAGICGFGNGSGGFAVDSIVSLGSGMGCGNQFEDQNNTMPSFTSLQSDSLLPQQMISYTICPTNGIAITQTPCFSCYNDVNPFVTGNLTSMYSSTSFTNLAVISNYTQTFNPSLPTYTMSFATPGYYSFQFFGQGGFGEFCNSQTYFVTVKSCLSAGISTVNQEKIITSYYNNYDNNIMVTCISNSVLIEKVELYDLVGKLILEKNNVNEKQIQLPASNLLGTLFILKVTTNNGISINKVLVQK